MDERRYWSVSGPRQLRWPAPLRRQSFGAAWGRLMARLQSATAVPSVDGAQQLTAAGQLDADARSSTLIIKRQRYEHGVHYLMSGDLDVATAPALQQCYEREDGETDATILLDLAEIAFMDAAGIGALIDAYTQFGERLVIIVGPVSADALQTEDLGRSLPIIEGMAGGWSAS